MFRIRNTVEYWSSEHCCFCSPSIFVPKELRCITVLSTLVKSECPRFNQKTCITTITWDKEGSISETQSSQTTTKTTKWCRPKYQKLIPFSCFSAISCKTGLKGRSAAEQASPTASSAMSLLLILHLLPQFKHQCTPFATGKTQDRMQGIKTD